jgi:hypothetical protein
MVDQIDDEGALCILGPLHESNGGECTFDDNDRSPAQTDLRPYIDQVFSLLYY